MPEDVDILIQRLDALSDGESAVRDLIASGPRAIGPLRRLLLDGRPGVTFQPRQWAVQALAGLGAKDALIAYLERRREIANPATRLAEEAVESTAARALKAWPTEEVIALMLKLAATHILPGVIETLGEVGSSEATPYFIKALEDDVCRRAAEEALARLGVRARAALVDAALSRAPSPEEESPSSLRRRRSALALLGSMLLPRGCWRALRSCLDDRDAEIVLGAAKIAAKQGCGNLEDKRVAIQRLLAVLPGADSFLQEKIEACLQGLLKEARSRGSRS